MAKCTFVRFDKLLSDCRSSYAATSPRAVACRTNSQLNAAQRPNMSSWVLDASAILALSNQELGADEVEQAIGDGAAASAVNLSEAVAKLSADRADSMVREFLDGLQLQVVPFDAEAAYQTGFLRNATKHLSLSLEDRAFRALARQLSVPVHATDRAWQQLQLGITARLIRLASTHRKAGTDMPIFIPPAPARCSLECPGARSLRSWDGPSLHSNRARGSSRSRSRPAARG